MIPSRNFAAILVAILAGAAAAFYLRAQPQGQTSNSTQTQTSAAAEMDRNLVVLDPAHGGQDAGAILGDNIYEKDVTLAIAARLRATLTAAGFTVLSTRDADSATPLTNDQRAEIANRAHALACIVLHATASGLGVHLYTSALQPPDEDASADISLTPHPAFVPVPWEMAQAASVSQSLRLVGDLSAAMGKANFPTVSGHAEVRPLDNLQCPAVAIELAPLADAGSGATPVTDTNYQQRVSAALTTALLAWRGHVEPTVPNATPAFKGGAKAPDLALQAEAAAEAARAAAEAAGRAAAKRAAARAAADRPQAAPGGQDQSSEGKAAPASSTTDSRGNPTPSGGTP